MCAFTLLKRVLHAGIMVQEVCVIRKNGRDSLQSLLACTLDCEDMSKRRASA